MHRRICSEYENEQQRKVKYSVSPHLRSQAEMETSTQAEQDVKEELDTGMLCWERKLLEFKTDSKLFLPPPLLVCQTTDFLKTVITSSQE